MTTPVVSRIGDTCESVIAELVQAFPEIVNEHCQRLAGLCYEFVKCQPLTETDALIVVVCACLHDAGQTHPEAERFRLDKSRRVWSEAERRQYSLMHCELATVVLDRLDLRRFDWCRREIYLTARHHHTPYRSLPADVPWHAQCVQVADHFDALTNARDYPKPLLTLIEAAKEVLLLGGLNIFNPAVTVPFVLAQGLGHLLTPSRG